MSRMFLIVTMYVVAPAYAYFEAAGFPAISVNGTLTIATQLIKTLAS